MHLKQLAQINPTVKLVRNKEHPFVEMQDIVPGYRYVGSDKKRIFKGSNSRFKNGDILFARITPCLENGKIAQYLNETENDAFGSTEFVIMRHIEEVSDPSFLYYLVSSDIVTKPAEKSMFGASGRQRVDVNALGNLEVPNYTLDTQRRIAAILTPIDNLIHVNLKRSRILARIAQELYDEWFVHFRFPEYDNKDIIQTEFGRIPRRWQFSNLGDISNIIMGQSPKSIHYNEKGQGLPFHQGVTNFGEIFPSTKSYSTKGDRIAELDDILFSVRAPVGRINIALNTMILGRGLCGIRSKTGNQAFLYEQLKRIFHEENIMGGGTIFNSVTKKDMHEIRVILPEKSVMDKFEFIAKPIIDQIKILVKKNNELLEIRKLLSHKLLSEDIDFNKLKIVADSD